MNVLFFVVVNFLKCAATACF